MVERNDVRLACRSLVFSQGLARTLFRLNGAGSGSKVTKDVDKERAVGVRKGSREREAVVSWRYS